MQKQLGRSEDYTVNFENDMSELIEQRKLGDAKIATPSYLQKPFSAAYVNRLDNFIEIFRYGVKLVKD